MIFSRSLLIFLLLFMPALLFPADREKALNNVQYVRLSATEKEIFLLINNDRKLKGLNPVALSPSLCYVAQCHVKDLAENNPSGKICNLHSWSDKGPWSACCYTGDHRKAPCMWSKPAELTRYKSEGYEIAYWTNEVLTPEQFAVKAFRGWKNSPDHYEVIINRGQWSSVQWKAMGIGYYKGYTVVWFGTEPDTEQLVKD